MTVTEKRKLTRSEACEELAKATGWTTRPAVCCEPPHPNCHVVEGAVEWLSPSGQRHSTVPNFFKSRDDAATLIMWLLVQCEKFETTGGTLLASFYSALTMIVSRPTDSYYEAQARLIAAPAEAQTLAVCVALGIKVKQE